MTIAVRPPLTPLQSFEAFALDSSSIQLSIRDAGPTVTIDAGPITREVETVDGAAVVDIDGLEADTPYDVVMRDPQGDRRLVARTRPDIGEVTTRIATISDVHLGLEEFGVIRKLRDDDPFPYALRGAIAAVREAEAWGAELLVMKGDLCESGTEADWDLVGRLAESATIPIVATPGNHEVLGKEEIAPREGFVRAGLDYAPVHVLDRPGVRLIVGDTSVPGRGSGTFDTIDDEVVAAVRSSPEPVLLAIHHNIERLPVPWFWPPGIRAHRARPILGRLARLNRPLFMTSGHTHRNRLHHLGPEQGLLFTEVSSTSDYPGVWAGYEVTATTIRQTVRRIGDPDVVRWTERTRRAVGGIWPRWSQGRLDDRCVDLPLG